MSKIHPNVERIMLTGEEITTRTKELAKQLDKLYEGRTPVVVCILKGSVVFFADLIRNMETPLTIDFMSVSSYGKGTKSTGELVVKKDLATDIAGRDVLIVEDIIDSGNTLYNLKKMLIGRMPASVNIVTLLDKPERREVPMEPESIKPTATTRPCKAPLWTSIAAHSVANGQRWSPVQSLWTMRLMPPLAL